jgi:tRNA pseudouridine synthase 10
MIFNPLIAEIFNPSYNYKMATLCHLFICSACSSILQLSSSREPTDEASQEDMPSAKKLKASQVCQYCLDLMMPSHQDILADEISRKITAEGYNEITSFQLCISISPLISFHQGIVEISSSKVRPSQQFDLIKDQLKFNLIRMLSSRTKLAADANSSFKITLILTHNDIAAIYSKHLVQHKPPVKGKKRLKDVCITHEVIRKALESCKYEEACGLVPSHAIEEHCHVQVDCCHSPLYIGGRYNKYSRHLSQSPWIIDGVKKHSTSVQEIIEEHVKKMCRPDGIMFSSSGREDVDVRMIGSGRPFMLELINPRKVTLNELECKELADYINNSTSDVFVRSLKMVTRKDSNILKRGEEEKVKLYSALIWSSLPLTDDKIQCLNDVKDLTIYQKTPIRVLHRRSLATREKVIHTLNATLIDEHHFQLDLSTQAGTYIKEFIHGDFHRTNPNLCDILGHNVDIIALDVTDILLDWPI